MKLKESQSYRFSFLLLSSFNLSTVLFWKKKCLCVPGFLQCGAFFVPSITQMYLLNYCKLNWEESLFDLYEESLAFRIIILMNIFSI